MIFTPDELVGGNLPHHKIAGMDDLESACGGTGNPGIERQGEQIQTRKPLSDILPRIKLFGR